MTDSSEAAAPDEARRRRAVLYGIPIALAYVGGFVGTASMAYLASKAPLALVALSPVFRNLVLASRKLDALSLFAVAVPRHFFPDIFAYLLGRQYGVTGIEWLEANSPASGRMLRFFERMFAKGGFLVLLVSPDLITSALAGAARLPLTVFVVANVVGTIGTVAVARYVGDVFDAPIRALLDFFQAHLFGASVACVLLAVLLNWRFRDRSKEAATSTRS